MKTSPAKNYKNPAYPTRLEVLNDPELLRKNLPPAWRAMPQMAGSLALFLAVNSSLHGAEKKAAGLAGAAAVVAPVFEHGEGRGATGCVMVAPPVFLSEEEAWQVISEELAKQGVNATTKPFEVKGVTSPEMRDHPGSFALKPYQADGADTNKHVAVEFVSSEDYQRLGGAFSMSTVQVYNFKDVAKSVGERVAKDAKEKVYFGVMYDPSTPPKRDTNVVNQPKTPEDWRKQWQERDREGRAESKRLLRLQVQDFLKWLQGQGVI